MSIVVSRGENGERRIKEDEFHEVTLTATDVLRVRAQKRPVVIVVPPHGSITVTDDDPAPVKGIKLEIAEVIDTEESEQLLKKLGEETRERKRLQQRAKREARRRRRLEREPE